MLAHTRSRRPHLALLGLANAVLLIAAITSADRARIVPFAVVAAIFITLAYLFVWNRTAMRQ
jgi:hypothetical protein